MKKFSFTRYICIMGVFIAITSVLALVLTFRIGTQMKISLKFISVFISGALLGPVPAGICAMLSDMANAFLMPVGPWLWQISLTEFIAGYIFGLFFYRAKDNKLYYLRAFLCSATQSLLSLFVVTWVLASLNILPGFKSGVYIRLGQAVIMFFVYFLIMCLSKKFVFRIKRKEGVYIEKL